MRADRLVATLLFLQARGTVTASEVAAELEVSTRTARRDLEALQIAGIPVYSQSGRGGGWSLIGGSRTDLTGLTADEARTLFLIAGPSSAITPEAKAALRKLIQALPETFRAEAEQAASAIVLDPAGWGRTTVERPPHLDELQRAVVQGRQVQLGYRDREGSTTRRRIHPLGLVSKASTWYLIADTERGRRTFRVWRVRSVEVTDDPVDRPDDFDLGAEWDRIAAGIDELRGVRRVELLVDPRAIGGLRAHFGSDRVTAGPATSDGRLPVEVVAAGNHHLAHELAGYAHVAEVVAPDDLRRELADIGECLVRQHASIG